MNDKGIYVVGILLCITLFMIFNYYISGEPDMFSAIIQPIPGTDQVGNIGEHVVIGDPIEPINESEDEMEPTKIYLGEFKLTAYCPCSICQNKWGTRVADNPIQGRTIAVDPAVIPHGTSVYIEGYGTFVAEDTGGLIRDNCIDIFYNDHILALNFGVRYADVYLED